MCKHIYLSLYTASMATTQPTRGVDLVLAQYRATVCDADPILDQHKVNALLGKVRYNPLDMSVSDQLSSGLKIELGRSRSYCERVTKTVEMTKSWDNIYRNNSHHQYSIILYLLPH